MGVWIWALVAFAFILMIAFIEWLNFVKFRTKQDKQDASTKELEATVGTHEAALEASEAERETLVRRIQNLEAIVTSQAWDAPPEDDGRVALPEEQAPLDASNKAEETARLVRLVRPEGP